MLIIINVDNVSSKINHQVHIVFFTACVKTWGSKNISYAGRATLINSVLLGIIGFCAGMLLVYPSPAAGF